MTFKKWIMKYVDECSPLGDLARDIKHDENFPRAACYKTLHKYLMNQGAINDCLSAFEKAYALYKDEINPKRENQ